MVEEEKLNEMENKNAKRVVFLIASGMDMLLGGLGLLLYFGILPLDLDELGFPRWVVGAVGAMLVLSGVVVFSYILSTTEPSG